MILGAAVGCWCVGSFLLGVVAGMGIRNRDTQVPRGSAADVMSPRAAAAIVELMQVDAELRGAAVRR